MLKIFSKNVNFRRGFSLIELSLALVVISSLAVLALTRMTQEKVARDEQGAIDGMTTIKKAIDYFVQTNKYYPCPAQASVAYKKADKSQVYFGRSFRDGEGNCMAGENTEILNTVPNVDGYRAANYDDHAARLGALGVKPYVTKPDVLMGDVPCTELGLPLNCAFDPQGNKYAYMVVPSLARAGKNDTPIACNKYLNGSNPSVEDLAKIRILKRYDGTSTLDDTYADTDNTYVDSFGQQITADYALIYFGKDGLGAYNDAGNRVEPAGTPGHYVNDNVYQEINHNIHTSFDQYLLAPGQPLASDITFGDIVMFGQNNDLRIMTCLRCTDCAGEFPAWSSSPKIMSISCVNCSAANVCSIAAAAGCH